MMNSATSNSTIDCLRSVFSVHELPETIITDNGAVFMSYVLQDFMANGIRPIQTAPYHPVKNLKKGSKDSLQTQISRFLFRY